MTAAARPRIQRRALHGVLLLDKPRGVSSNAALQRARWLLRAEKAGHTGTLDPLAEGLLPLCFGAATKFSQLGLDADKRYLATLQLGVETSSGDAEGEVVARGERLPRAAEVAAACARFTGPLRQTPPMHSALKHEGRALYDYARDGIEIERAAREVVVHSLVIVEQHDARLCIDVRCSKGTYIRALATDIGRALGCGAHLTALRRTASGALRVDDAIGLDAFEALAEPAREALLRPVDALLADAPRLLLAPAEAARFVTGLSRRVQMIDTPLLRVHGVVDAVGDSQIFLGSAQVVGGELKPLRLLSPHELESTKPSEAFA